MNKMIVILLVMLMTPKIYACGASSEYEGDIQLARKAYVKMFISDSAGYEIKTAQLEELTPEEQVKRLYGIFCNSRQYLKSIGEDIDKMPKEDKEELKEMTTAFQEFLKNPSKEPDDDSGALGILVSCGVVNKSKAELLSSGCKDSGGKQASALDIKKAIQYCSQFEN